MAARVVDSLERAQHFVPAIVRGLRQDPALSQRALANPLMAAEELGYQFTPEIRPVLERRVRFPLATFDKLERLSRRVQRLAGHRFNIDSPAELDTVLFSELGLRRPRRKPGDPDPITAPLPAAVPAVTNLASATPAPAAAAAPADPLGPLRGRNPIMAPLLEYRALEASAPRLAPREVYEQLKAQAVELPLTQVSFRLQRQASGS